MTDAVTSLPPPGADPVADHGWCCAHSEQWRYFDPGAETRMLTALGAIFRVDPVETEFLLDLAEWAATEAALPVAERLVASGDLAPKLARRAAALRSTLDPAQTSPTPGDGADDGTPTGPDTTSALIDRLHQIRDPAGRDRIVVELAARAAAGGTDRLAVACELLGERHPAGATLMASLVTGVDRTALTDEQRAIAAMACAASSLDGAIAPLVSLLGDGRAMDAHDLYEAVKAVASHPPPGLDAAGRATLDGAVRQALQPKTRIDRARALVIDAMLLGVETRRRVAMASFTARIQPLTRGEKAVWIRSLAEASGWIDTPASVRRLARLVTSDDRSVRNEAMRALRRLGTPAAAQVALRGLGALIAARSAVDIDAAEAIHTAIDLLVRTGTGDACNALTRILRHEAFDGHGVQGRAAIALAQLDDARCLLPHGPSGLPHLVRALLLPQPVTPGRSRSSTLFDAGVAWLERHAGRPFDAADAPNEHLRRVHTSRRILAWSNTSQGRTSNHDEQRSQPT